MTDTKIPSADTCPRIHNISLYSLKLNGFKLGMPLDQQVNTNVVEPKEPPKKKTKKMDVKDEVIASVEKSWSNKSKNVDDVSTIEIQNVLMDITDRAEWNRVFRKIIALYSQFFCDLDPVKEDVENEKKYENLSDCRKDPDFVAAVRVFIDAYYVNK